MNLRKILPGFIALLTLTVVISSCLNDDNLIPANCFDGILNNGEFDGIILASFISLAVVVAVSGLENILRTQEINCSAGQR